MSDKPRQFWIATEGTLGRNESGGSMYIAHTLVKSPKKSDIHVIDKSAFDTAVKALKEFARGESQWMDGVECMHKARETLKALGVEL